MHDTTLQGCTYLVTRMYNLVWRLWQLRLHCGNHVQPWYNHVQHCRKNAVVMATLWQTCTTLVQPCTTLYGDCGGYGHIVENMYKLGTTLVQPCTTLYGDCGSYGYIIIIYRTTLQT